ncbi:MAG: hypothetical protein PHG83_02030 [Patescibacteria group bacterium]|nr:hypothetical protein [Patescibacteria group bacterium]
MNILSQSWWIDVVERICNKLELTPMQFGIIMQNPKVLEELEAIFRKYSKADEIVAEAIVAVIKEEKKVNLILPPKGFPYTGPKPIERQVEILAKIFKRLNPGPTFEYIKEVLPTLQLPNGAEGWFAIPSIQALFPKIAELDRQYYCAVKFLLSLIPTNTGIPQDFQNYRRKEITPNHLRRSDKTKDALERIAEIQKELSIWIIPAQTGFLYQDITVREFRKSLISKNNEFALGLPEIIAILLTHIERISEGCLNIDCAGDEFRPQEIWGWELYVLAFSFLGGIKLGTHETDNFNRDCKDWAPASGFLPRVEL